MLRCLKKRLLEKYYSEKKIQAVTRVLRTKLLCLNPTPKTNTPFPDEKMLNQFKKKFNSTKNKSTKMQILTVLPKTWSVKKIIFLMMPLFGIRIN